MENFNYFFLMRALLGKAFTFRNILDENLLSVGKFVGQLFVASEDQYRAARLVSTVRVNGVPTEPRH